MGFKIGESPVNGDNINKDGNSVKKPIEGSGNARKSLERLKKKVEEAKNRAKGLPKENKLHIEKETEKEVFDVITEEEIDDCKKDIMDKLGIDLSDISINIIHPGETDFNHYEIRQNLFLKCDSDFGKMINLIKGYGYNPENLTLDQFKDITDKEGIALEGKFPSFAMTAGDDEIIFFGIKEENLVDMAERFAEKEGEKEENISNVEDAKTYLGGLGKKYFLHEAGLVVYKAMEEYLQEEWKNYIEKYPELKEKIIEIQKDRYSDEKQIPVPEEAFADFFIDVASDKEGFSRLGENTEATDKIREFLFVTKEMQNNPYEGFMGENNEYKKRYPKEMENLNAIAQKAGFKELLALEKMQGNEIKNIECIAFSKDYCIFPANGLENQRLIEKIDKNFADKGVLLIMRHEKQHFVGPSKKLSDKNIDMDEEKKYFYVESQTNLQSLSENIKSEKLENKEEIINTIITENIYKDFIYNGIDALKEESKADYYFKVYKFIDPDIVEEIVKEENKFKKELLKKYHKIKEEK